MPKRIPLSQGKFALVDDADFEWLSKFKWCCIRGYAARRVTNGNRPTTLYMHRAVLNASSPCVVDHVNGDGLDNRRENLRIATIAQNKYNQRRRKESTSQYKGVRFVPSFGKWTARIGKNGARHHLGSFDTEVEAARAYNAAARLLYGPYAWVNDVPNDDLVFHSLPQPVTASRYRGVSLNRHGKWQVSVQAKRKRVRLGSFDSEEAAARAYDAYVVAHGLKRPLNFPD